jgi:hypothetical protein
MKNGDVIVNVNEVFKVTFKGWIAGSICCYNIEFNVPASEFGKPGDVGYYPAYDQKQQFTGTVSQMLEHAGSLVRNYNKYVVGAKGGQLI